MENVSLGSYLKEIRERRGIKLEEISRETKILKKVLESLENNDFSLIPEVYLKGIIRKYFQILKVKEEEAQEIFRQLEEYWGKKSEIALKEKTYIKQNKLSFSFRFFVPILFLFLAFYFLYEISLFILPAKISLNNTSFITSEKNFLLKGQAIRAKSVLLNGKELYLNEKGFFEETLVLEKGVNNIELKALNPLGRETVKILTIIYQAE